MSIFELMEENRKKEFIAIFRFLDTCDTQELAHIIEEIRCVHDNLMAWNEDKKSFDKIASVSINGECIQLNLERGKKWI